MSTLKPYEKKLIDLYIEDETRNAIIKLLETRVTKTDGWKRTLQLMEIAKKHIASLTYDNQ